MKTLRQRVGASLEGRRKALKLTRDALSERSGIEPQTLRNYEKGDRWPDPEKIELLAKPLGCLPEEILAGTDLVPRDQFEREQKTWADAVERLKREADSLRLALQRVLSDRDRDILAAFATFNDEEAAIHVRMVKASADAKIRSTRRRAGNE